MRDELASIALTCFEEIPHPLAPTVKRVCGAPLVAMGEDLSTTCVGYEQKNGHGDDAYPDWGRNGHDRNCVKRAARCADGHVTSIAIRRRCLVDGCDWLGPETCFCHPGGKLDVWPDLPIEARLGWI